MDLLPTGVQPGCQFCLCGGRSPSVLAHGGHLAAQHGAHEPQDWRPQDGKDPRVDDGINRQKPQGQEVPVVGVVSVLFATELVHVGADLQNTMGRNNVGSGLPGAGPRAASWGDLCCQRIMEWFGTLKII